MKFYSLITASILSIAFTMSVQAQESDLANSGSFYSGFGIGAPADIYSPYTMGMGLSGVSTFSVLAPNLSNPAQWGYVNYTQGNIALGVDNYISSDDVTTSQNSKLSIDNFQIVLPLKRNRLGVSLLFIPLTRSDYQRFSGGSFQPVPDLDLPDVNYQTRTNGSGGINRFELGAGLRITNFLSLGYGFSANLLSLQQETLSAFPANSPYRSSSFNRSIEGYGFGHRFGAFTNFSNIFSSRDQLLLGATINFPVTVDADESITSYQQIAGRPVLVELNENSQSRSGSVQQPLEFNSGLTYNINQFSTFTAELMLQQWDDADFSYSQQQQQYYKDRLRAGLGFQFHPYRRDQQGGFFSNFKYSLGSSFDNGHLAINNQNIETIFFNAGIGLPSPRSFSSIDLSFQYGIRGTHSSNLVKENIWAFKLSLNLAENMFVRPKFQ